MAEVYCQACEDIKQAVPELVVNGFTNEMCASLKNDTGLKPSVGHNDCTDLNNLNDCLIGNMEAELERYDVCDWKEFMEQYASNDWTNNKAMICAICGIWEQIHSILQRLQALEQRMNNVEQRVTNLEDEVQDIWDCLNS